MNLTLVRSMLLAGPALLLSSCGGSTTTAGDASVDSLDEARDVVAEESPPVQGPITFIVRNVSGGLVYLEYTMGPEQVVHGARTTGGAWADVGYFPPPFMLDCDSVAPGSECCVIDDIVGTVKELGGGQEIRIEWDGRSVFGTVSDYCTCTCYMVLPAEPMGYKATACTYDAFNCFSDPCEPDAEGIYEGTPAGDPTCFETIFDIPYAGTEVVIEVQ